MCKCVFWLLEVLFSGYVKINKKVLIIASKQAMLFLLQAAILKEKSNNDLRVKS